MHHIACRCCSPTGNGFSRRRLLQLGGACLVSALAVPALAAVPAREYEALVLICNEPRVWQQANNYLKTRDLAGKYQPVEVIGGAIGLVAEQYQSSRDAFWETLMSAAAWQQTSRVIALNHRGCVAMKTAYGLSKFSDNLLETETHRHALQLFRKQVAERNAALDVEIGLIDANGKVQMFK